MNPYERKRRWKFILLAFATIIVGASLWYTDYLVRNISTAERTRAELWAKSTRNIIAMPDVNDEYITFIYSMRDSLAVPAIVVDSAENIITWRGLDSTKTNFDLEADSKKKYDPKYFKSQLKAMKSQHPQPIVLELNNRNNEKWYVYYKDSTLLTQLRAFPYVQLSVIAIFLLVAYGVFNSSRKSEQDQVWVGLAKETAHQLGTPISSLMAWVELLKSKFNAPDDPLIIEMENDVKRLEMVADRFSKIGSKPILHNHVVYEVVEEFVNYFRVRVSDKIEFILSGDKHVEALINVPLFDWVIENILKNAVNAIEGQGSIKIEIKENLVKEQVFIDITDTGAGIPRLKFDTVFQPGYTTRKRGWGLGLSLTKRIVENYHQGSVFVKDSEIGKGTTFRIVLKSNMTYEATTS
ncbi:Histidine kinase-, DNA gyrase B-, and HSP90-like ATPase [Daejeonella rubra]|uniref:histidine kinase n=1 Tax=Daejeonella rubra TaxID=990371 RepID=A0A1G9Q6F3_9SPHI|nr:HAMP domain-containing sensor histidine kinase [Daejeonella rubra]SDM06608.1 Histidine kinase-, DNA gyrase B-, and HSP90-like ATPase [Daejeonella rubra]